MAVFAFAHGRRIGVDVERVRTDLAWEEIAAQFFTPRENERLQRLREPQRQRAFLRMWTCKEAYVKARGQGLSFPVNRVEVSFSPPALRRVGADENEAARWRVRELRVGGAYVATVVVEEDEGRLRCWQWR
jgi:4'-phosphopantetheinyl transferase